MSNYKFGIARGFPTNVAEEEAPVIIAKEIRSESINLIEEIALLVENSQFQSAMEKISPALEGDYSAEPMMWYYYGFWFARIKSK